jgi:hypothetical protein
MCAASCEPDDGRSRRRRRRGRDVRERAAVARRARGNLERVRGVTILVLVLAAAACGGKRATAADCEAACARLITLAIAEIEGTEGLSEELRANLVALARESQESDMQTCVGKCGAGHLDTACVAKADNVDQAATCAKRPGERGGKSPPDKTWEQGGSWVDRPLSRTRAAMGATRFSIELPGGLASEVGDDYVHWEVAHGSPWGNPQFEVQPLEALPDDEELGEYLRSGSEVLRRETSAERATLVFHNEARTYVTAWVFTRAGDGALACMGTQSAAGGLADLEAIGAWFVRVCATLRVEP